jgi:hypothetical protein
VGWTGQARIGGRSAAPCVVELSDEALDVLPEGGDPVHLPLVDIEDVHDDNYVLRLTDHLGTPYELTMLGRAYGQIAAEVRERRNAALEHDLLLVGVNLQDSFPGKLFGDGPPIPVEIRLYEDLMVVVPERGAMFGIPFSYVASVDWDETLYQVRVATDDDVTFVFGHLAKRSEEFRDELRRLLDALARRTASTLGAMLPGLETGILSALAGRMRDGRAVQQWEVNGIDPSVWPRLEQAAVGTEELRDTYERLKAMTPAGWAAFGVKAVLTEQPKEGPARMGWKKAGVATDRDSRSEWRDTRDQSYANHVPGFPDRLGPSTGSQGGMPGRREAEASAGGATVERAPRADGGEETATARGTGAASADAEAHQGKRTTDRWYFCPLSVDGQPVNAVAHEVASELGHATYLFRLTEPERWPSLSGEAQTGEVSRGIARLNRALLQLNFRREPIYLSEEQIQTGQYARYRVALRKLDHLRWARRAFLGRAIHNASWESQVRRAIEQA